MGVVATVGVVAAVRVVAAMTMVRGVMASGPVRVAMRNRVVMLICLNTGKRKKGGKNDPHSFFDYYSDLA